MSILPSSNIINVTITDTPSGLTEKNVNSLALFTTERPSNLNPFGIYISASQVATDFGTNSVTAQMANAVFSQTPNILSGDGRLVIIPLKNAVSATRGQVVTPDISANLASIIAVTSGDLKVTINGVASNLTGLDFTGCTTLVDIAAILQANLLDVTVTANTTAITMKSKKVGSTSTVTLGAVSGGTGTALNGAGYLNAAGSTSTSGANSSGETILNAISRTDGLVGYVPVMTNLDLEDNAILAVAAGIQAMDKMFLQHASSSQDILGIATTVSAAEEKKTRILTYLTGVAEANLYKAAYCGRGFSVNFNGSNTVSTMNLKSLSTISPDLGITQTLYVQAGNAGTDLYVSYDGVSSVFSTGGNDFFDNPYCDLALKFALETAGFNFLRQTNTKVPQTEQGMNGLKSAYAQVLEQFIRNGAIAPGEWNSSETFGDPEIFKNNVRTRGYYIYSLPVAQQSAAERNAREAPLVQIAVKRAGAIHTSDVLVLVNN